ncbi:MAG: NPCBM/NEW2 domain-containing protein, partial [Planctomycetes bacterium]|nr:NPCBM/NEW2 domain-containing protein [Planctomycetota bacterium]
RRPYVASRLPQPSLERLFQPRRDIGMTGKPLSLDGVIYDKGLALTTRTEMVFRLLDDYRYFHAVVGIDDNVRDGGNLELVVSGDDKVLLTRTVTGREKSFPLDLDITGVKRLKILADFGQEMDIADHLDLCDARLTK